MNSHRFDFILRSINAATCHGSVSCINLYNTIIIASSHALYRSFSRGMYWPILSLDLLESPQGIDQSSPRMVFGTKYVSCGDGFIDRAILQHFLIMLL